MTSTKQIAQPKRIYKSVAKQKLIERIHYWNADKKRYEVPTTGALYRARRLKRNARHSNDYESRQLANLADCLQFQRYDDGAAPWEGMYEVAVGGSSPPTPSGGLTLGGVVERWKRKKFAGLATGTRHLYERLIAGSLSELLPVEMSRFTPARIDEWLEKLTVKATSGARSRVTIEREFEVLTILINFHQRHIDENFASPLRKRHREDLRFKSNRPVRRLDLEVDEFLRFHAELAKLTQSGDAFARMAMIQFTCALRISEAAALRWEDVRLMESAPERSCITIRQHVIYLRRKDKPDHIAPGFKNSSDEEPEKTLPLSALGWAALYEHPERRRCGLIFRNAEGTFFTMRQIQYAYDTAFQRAQLPYRGTHVLRHGGATWVQNLANGDPHTARMILGNNDMDTVLHYAKRNKTALTNALLATWDRPPTGAPASPAAPNPDAHM